MSSGQVVDAPGGADWWTGKVTYERDCILNYEPAWIARKHEPRHRGRKPRKRRIVAFASFSELAGRLPPAKTNSNGSRHPEPRHLGLFMPTDCE